MRFHLREHLVQRTQCLSGEGGAELEHDDARRDACKVEVLQHLEVVTLGVDLEKLDAIDALGRAVVVQAYGRNLNDLGRLAIARPKTPTAPGCAICCRERTPRGTP